MNTLPSDRASTLLGLSSHALVAAPPSRLLKPATTGDDAPSAAASPLLSAPAAGASAAIRMPTRAATAHCALRIDPMIAPSRSTPLGAPPSRRPPYQGLCGGRKDQGVS